MNKNKIFERINQVLKNFLNQNLTENPAILKDKITLVSGHSGVGKSTLINALVPNSDQKVSEISKSYNKGRHTTTFAQMFVGENGCRVIDTPGIKDFGIVNMEPNQVSHFFPEMRELLPQCKFSNCLHTEEPECKVLESLERGEMPVTRYVSYLGILEEITG